MLLNLGVYRRCGSVGSRIVWSDDEVLTMNIEILNLAMLGIIIVWGC